MRFEPNNSENIDLSFSDNAESSFMASEVDLPEFNFNKIDLGFDGEYHNAGGKLKKTFSDANKSIKSEVKKAGVSVKAETKKASVSVKSEAKKVQLKGRVVGKKIESKVQKFIDKNEGGVLAHKLNRVNPAMIAVRGAIISMLQINLFNIAKSFSIMKDASDKGKSKYWNDVLQKWWIVGGDKDKLNHNVNRGKTVKDKIGELVKKLKKKKGFDGGYSNAGGENIGKVVADSAALLGSATAVLLSIPEPATKAAAAWTGTGAGFLGAVSPMLRGFAQENGATEEELAEIPEPTTTEYPPQLTPEQVEEYAKKAAEEEDKIMGIPKTGFWIAAGLLAVIIIGGIALSNNKK